MSTSRFIHRLGLPENGEVVLCVEESHHLANVLRLEEGVEIEIVDGRGMLARARIESVSAKGARARISTIERHPPSSRLVVGFGIPKPAALEFILRRCTEVGVDGFQPLITRYSLRMNEWNERRWTKIIDEVGKQSQELNFPSLRPPVALDAWLSSRDASRTLVLFDETNRAARGAISGGNGVDILVGPEGGWSSEELGKLGSRGAISFGLGKNRLRAEMAALIGTALVKREMGEI